MMPHTFRRRLLRRNSVISSLTLLALSVGTSQAGAQAQIEHQAPEVCSFQTTPISERPRTIVTTDGEIDDKNSMRRLLYYSNDLDLAGLIYTSSVHHWRGDGERTLEEAVADGVLTSARGQTAGAMGSSNQSRAWRWEPLGWIEDMVLEDYAEIYPNLVRHDRRYPYPAELWSEIAVGNIDFENDFSTDTAGSDLIRNALLDDDPRKIYLQAWGGMNTIARALKSIEEEYSEQDEWNELRERVKNKAVIVAIGHQDNAYENYISGSWSDITTFDLSGSFLGFTPAGAGMVEEANRRYFLAPWWPENIKYGHGPLLQDYVLFGDGSYSEGEGDNPNWQPGQVKDFEAFRMFDFVGPVQPLSFAGEGDTPSFLLLLNSGFRTLEDPTLGGWSGRLAATGENPAYFASQKDVSPLTDQLDAAYGVVRWIDAIQNDFAARADWGVTAGCRSANHAPIITLRPSDVSAHPGQTIHFDAALSDPDGNDLELDWTIYREAGSVEEASIEGNGTGGCFKSQPRPNGVSALCS